MTALSCSRCGRDVPVPEVEGGASLWLVCPACGNRMPVSVPRDEATAPAAGDPAATVPLGSRTALLEPDADDARDETSTTLQPCLVLVGADPGSERFALAEGRTSLGREAADVLIADPAMSSRHFEIEVRAGEYFLRDLDSSNGTFLNGARVRAAEIVDGDKIKAGQSILTFRTFEVLVVVDDLDTS